MFHRTRTLPGVAIAALLLAPAPALAAKVEPGSRAGEYRLDPEGGDVRTALGALAAAIGASLVGDAASLDEKAPAAVLAGRPERLIQRLLSRQDYVVKSDASGRIRQIVILSGARGQDPTLPARTAETVAPAAPPANASTTTRSLARMAQQLAAAGPGDTMELVNPPADGEKRSPRPTDPGPPGSRPPAASLAPAPAGPPAPPVTITPEMQAEIAAATQRARGELQTLVEQLRAACPAGQTC